MATDALMSIDSIYNVMNAMFSNLLSSGLFRDGQAVPTYLFDLLGLLTLMLFLFNPRRYRILSVVSVVLFNVSVNVLLYFLKKLVTVSVTPGRTANTTIKIVKVTDCVTTNLRSMIDNFLVRSHGIVVSKGPVCSFSTVHVF